MSPQIALRKAIRSALAADAPLVALLGGAKIYDCAPRGAEPPWIAFGEGAERDWSTMTDRGAEQRLALHVWSIQNGVLQALAIADRIRAILDEAPLVLDGHRLVRLAVLATETGRDGKGRYVSASLRLRALTEQF